MSYSYSAKKSKGENDHVREVVQKGVDCFGADEADVSLSQESANLLKFKFYLSNHSFIRIKLMRQWRVTQNVIEMRMI